MAVSIKVNISGDLAGEAKRLGDFRTDILGRKLNAQIGRRVGELFKERFFQLDKERPNKLGGERTHFYADAAKAVSSEGNANEAIVTVAQQGIRQRIEGGTIRPIKGKYLTIPARAEAYGHTAREFKNLRFVKTSRGGMLVDVDVQRVSFGRARKDGTRKVTPGAVQGGGAMFWLVPSVTQSGDRTILPRRDEVERVVHETVAAAIKRERK
jgi:hypothetical protein